MKNKYIKPIIITSSIAIFMGCETTSIKSKISFENEMKSVETLATEARNLIASKKFHENLMSLDSVYDEIWLRQTLNFRTKAEFSKLLKLNDAQNDEIRWVPTSYELKGKAIRRDNDIGFRHRRNDRWAGAGAKGYDSQNRELGRIYLGRLHLARYTIGNEFERSCAINTMAHEIGHTLSQSSSGYVEYLRDDTNSVQNSKGRPMGSYLVGALAQCTWLQNRGRINSTQVNACVETFRQQPFPTTRCNNFDDGIQINFPKISRE